MKFIPLSLLEHKAQRHQTLCHCWAIKPRFGMWEGFTSLERSIYLPQYEPLPGDEEAPPEATVPAMMYLHRAGLSLSSIPTRLDLSQQSADAMTLAFDVERLRAGYYDGAYFEGFEINFRGDLSARDILISGEFGSAEIDIVRGKATGAKLKLLPWQEKANQLKGRVCGNSCDVGKVPEIVGEEFGTMRCAGEFAPDGGPVPNDGVKKADWTTEAEVIAVTDRSVFKVRFSIQTVSNRSIYSGFNQRLEAGKVEFLTTEQGGRNQFQKREIKWATGTAHQTSGINDEATVELNVALPYLPEIGDKLHLVAGCRKTQTDCVFFGNFNGANDDNDNGGDGWNFQGFHKTPGERGARRRGRG